RSWVAATGRDAPRRRRRAAGCPGPKKAEMDHRSTTPTAGSVVTDTPPGIDPTGDPTGIDPTGIDPVGAEVPLATDAAPAELPPEIAPDTGQPVSRARTIRFAAGFLLFGTIWMVDRKSTRLNSSHVSISY